MGTSLIYKAPVPSNSASTWLKEVLIKEVRKLCFRAARLTVSEGPFIGITEKAVIFDVALERAVKPESTAHADLSVEKVLLSYRSVLM